jgi:hypothetical protein
MEAAEIAGDLRRGIGVSAEDMATAALVMAPFGADRDHPRRAGRGDALERRLAGANRRLRTLEGRQC